MHTKQARAILPGEKVSAVFSCSLLALPDGQVISFFWYPIHRVCNEMQKRGAVESAPDYLKSNY